MAIKYNTCVDTGNKLWLCSVSYNNADLANEHQFGEDSGITKKTLTLPEALSVYSTYRLNSASFYGDENIEALIIPEAVKYISAYSFVNSKIKRIKFTSIIPPVFHKNCFDNMGISASEPLIIEVFKGLKERYNNALKSHSSLINNEIIVIIENNDIVSSDKNYPPLYMAGETVDSQTYNSMPSSIGDMSHFGAIQSDEFDPAGENISFPAAIEANTRYIIDNKTVVSQVPGHTGYLWRFKSAQFDATTALNHDIRSNAFYQLAYNGTIKLSREVKNIYSFAFQEAKMTRLQGYFTAMDYIASNAFLNCENLIALYNRTTQQITNKYTVWEVNGTSLKLDSTGNGNVLLKFNKQINNKYYYDIIWASYELTIQEINTLLNHETYIIENIGPMCFAASSKNDYTNTSTYPASTLTLSAELLSIGDRAFSGRKDISSLIFNTTNRINITKKKLLIGDQAFANVYSKTMYFDGLGTLINQQLIDINNTWIYPAHFVVAMNSTNLAEQFHDPAISTIYITNDTDITNNINLNCNFDSEADVINKTIINTRSEEMRPIIFNNIGAKALNLTLVSLNEQCIYGSLLFKGGNSLESEVNITLNNVTAYGSTHYTSLAKGRPYDSFSSAMTVYDLNDNVKFYIQGTNKLIGGVSGEGIRTYSGKLNIDKSPDVTIEGAQLICIGNGGREHDQARTWRDSNNSAHTTIWKKTDIEYLHPTALQFNAANYSGSGGSGIGYASCEETERSGSIKISNLTKIVAKGYGSNAFGIGGGQVKPGEDYKALTVELNNCQNIFARGGFATRNFLYGQQGGAQKEGGAAIGVGIKKYLPYSTTNPEGYSGYLHIQDCHLARIDGGSKSAGIGSCLWSGIRIEIENTTFGEIYGGSGGAGIGGSLIRADQALYDKGDLRTPQNLYIQIKNPRMTKNGVIAGGRHGAGIGSGFAEKTCWAPGNPEEGTGSSHKCTIRLGADDAVNYDLYIVPGINAAGIGTGTQNAGLEGCVIDKNILTILKGNVNGAQPTYDLFGLNIPLGDDGMYALEGDTFGPIDQPELVQLVVTGEGKKIALTPLIQFLPINLKTDILFQNIVTPSVQPLLIQENGIYRSMPQRIGYGMCYFDGNTRPIESGTPLYNHYEAGYAELPKGIFALGVSNIDNYDLDTESAVMGIKNPVCYDDIGKYNCYKFQEKADEPINSIYSVNSKTGASYGFAL